MRYKMYDVVIIGSGPAGMSAAIYAGRAMLKVALIEKAPMGGGQIINTEQVDNYPGMPGTNGFELGMAMYNHALSTGVEIINGEAAKLENQYGVNNIYMADGTKIETRTVVIATGAHHRSLGVPGEEKYRGRGVSYCATCDGGFFRRKNVAVIGGGDVAVGDALYLANICENVYLINRRKELRASAILQDKMKSYGNISFIPDMVVDEICGNDSVESLVIKDSDENKQTIKVDGVFMAIGMEPENQLVKDILSLDDNGYVIAGEDGITNVDSIFVAGDLRTKHLRQVVTAVADGACVIKSIEKFLTEIG